MGERTSMAAWAAFALLASLGAPAPADGGGAADAWRAAHDRAGVYADCARNADAILRGWITRKCDPRTHLYSRGRRWDYHNEAADHYSSLVLAAYHLEPALNAKSGTLHQTLISSIRLCRTSTGLPGTYDLRTGTRGKSTVGQIAEWLRDGLIRIVEVMGTDNDWYRELCRLCDAVLVQAEAEGGLTRWVRDVEARGNLMQTFARLYAMSGEERYIAAGETLADAYLLGDPIAAVGRVQFVDHGCELVPGLAEVFVVGCRCGRPRAKAYRPALRKLLDRILAVGRQADTGLWKRWADLRTGRTGGTQPPDTWGYVLFAFENYDRATGERRYGEAVRKPMRWLVANRAKFASLRETRWPSSRSIDDWSDSYESMIVLWNRCPELTGVFDWLDWMTKRGGHRAGKAGSPFGPGNGGHFDGSTARTLCLHMMLCSQGVRAVPWAGGLGCGAVRDGRDLLLTLRSDRRWRGRLCFDRPRTEHKAAAVDWARINEMPQWYVVRPQREYAVSIDGRAPKTIEAEALMEGLKIDVSAEQTRRIRVRESPGGRRDGGRGASQPPATGRSHARPNGRPAREHGL